MTWSDIFDKSKKNKKGNYIARFVMKIPLLKDRPEGHSADPPDEGGSRS